MQQHQQLGGKAGGNGRAIEHAGVVAVIELVARVARIRDDHACGHGCIAHLPPVAAGLPRLRDGVGAALFIDLRAVMPAADAHRVAAGLAKRRHPRRALRAAGRLHDGDMAQRLACLRRFADKQVGVRLQEAAGAKLQYGVEIVHLRPRRWP
ncbi:hypothetical protein D3C72_1798790 [compost metagenome]